MAVPVASTGDPASMATVHRDRAAIVVIDMQNDFCHPEGAMARLGHDISVNHSLLEPLAGFLAAGRDAGLRVLYVQQQAGDDAVYEAMHRRVSPGETDRVPVCAAGTWGAEIHDAIAPREGDLLSRKSRFCAFLGTELDALLEREGIDTLLVTGTAANVCVDTTVRGAFMRGYRVVMVPDLIGYTNAAMAQAALDNLGIYFADLATSDQALAAVHPVARFS